MFYEATDSEGKCFDEEIVSLDIQVAALLGSPESLVLDTVLEEREEDTQPGRSGPSEYDSWSS